MFPKFGALKNKFSKESFSVGLDIGSTAIKLIKLKFLKETVELCGFDIVPLESGQKGLDSLLKNIAHTQNISTVNISVSGPAAIIRYVNFPKMLPEELKQALKFEAQKYIPFSVEEVNLDSSILKSDLPDKKMLVLLAAAKKEFLNQRLKLIESAGLKPSLVNIDSIALINAFNFSYSKQENPEHKALALLNIGAAQSNLNILEDGIPFLSRDINIAGNQFTQKIADIFGVDFRTAENLKLHPDKERADKVATAIESVLANLAAELRISFDYYESQSASSVGKIFLSGGGSLFTGLKDMLTGIFDIKIDYWNPLNKIRIPSNIGPKNFPEAAAGKAADKNLNGLKPLSIQSAIAIGLALC